LSLLMRIFMSRQLRLHPAYGLNPTIPMCFWCGKDKNELVMLGAAYKAEAPRSMIMDYIPCEECETKMNQGITLVECTHRQDKFPEIISGAYPTGRWCVVTEDYASRVFQPEAVLKSVLKHRKAFIEPDVMERMGITQNEPG